MGKITYFGYTEEVCPDQTTYKFTKEVITAESKLTPSRFAQLKRFASRCIITNDGKIIDFKMRYSQDERWLYSFEFPYSINNKKQTLLIPSTDNGAQVVEYIVQQDLDFNNLSIDEEFTLLMLGARRIEREEELHECFIENIF